MAENTKTICVFSSNQQPLYEQGILDVIASPRGMPYRFRYLEDYVAPDLRTRWNTTDLVGATVLVHFSLQQVAEYQPPALIPVRLATVTSAQIYGKYYFLDFELGDYVALHKGEGKKTRDLYGEPVVTYSRALEGRALCPYKAWASEGVGVLDLLDRGGSSREQSVLFERITDFLRNTDSFRHATYFRVLNIRKSGDEYAEGDHDSGLSCESGKYLLTAGCTYELTLFQTQPVPVDGGRSFTVSSDKEILSVVGKPSFTVSSRYDITTIYLYASQIPATLQHRQAMLSIDPEEGVQGPRVRLSCTVSVDMGQTLKGASATAAGVLLLGLPSLVPTLALSWKAVSILAATILLGALASVGLKRN
jgi:hypothetical protein